MDKFIEKNIPQELKKLPQWVAWQNKIPIDPNKLGIAYAKPNDYETWGMFFQAKNVCKKRSLDGIGFVFDKDNDILGIDIDHCRNPFNGKIESWAMDIVKAINSYTEISISGKGLHIYVKGKIPPGRRRGKEIVIEIYNDKHYFTVSGWHVKGTPKNIKKRYEAVMELYEEHFFRIGITARYTKMFPDAYPM